ncbi:MAG: hypothetical protein E6G26_01560 [Actinobacteria bacterium]|nr:MAG: hypothetical protein E6G26_01560 [Actinomycetota bacterium]
MRGWVAVLVVVLGVVVLCGVVAAASNGRDHTGDTVRASTWADAACGAVGAWEGDLHAIRDEYQRNNYAARQHDGGSGDSVEGRVTLREAIDRAIRATEDTLQEGLKRAGNPDVSNGAQASATLRAWAQRTEHNLRVAKQELKHKPGSTSEAYALVATQASALVRSILDGQAAFNQVANVDPALADALNGSKNCQELKEGQP